MTMTETRNSVATMKVYIRCTGKRKKNPAKTCGELIGILTVPEGVWNFKVKCPKCDTEAEFS